MTSDQAASDFFAPNRAATRQIVAVASGFPVV
jgi:hypothetical protein